MYNTSKESDLFRKDVEEMIDRKNTNFSKKSFIKIRSVIETIQKNYKCIMHLKN